MGAARPAGPAPRGTLARMAHRRVHVASITRDRSRANAWSRRRASGAARLGALPEWVVIAAIIALHALAAALVLRAGYLEYNADGYARIIRGHEWLDAPRWEVGVWLPLQTWLIGAALFLYDAPDVTPRVLSFLLSAWTLVNLYLLGRVLAGRIAGLLAATLGALLPWLVWFSMSGMSEALFHALLSAGVLGFARWLDAPGDAWRWLALGSGGLLASTMTRYEGWLYAVVFAVLIVGIAWRRGMLTPQVVALAALPLAFPTLWITEYWRVFGDPFGFARETAAIKSSLDAGNVGAGLLRRLTAYPEATFRLAPLLVALCGGAALMALTRRVWWWPLPALIVAQGALLAGISAGFSNLGPGAERYLLSNVVLLLPVLAAVAVPAPAPTRRLVGLALAVGAVLLLVPTLLRPPTWYPDADVRRLAAFARAQLPTLPASNTPVPVLLPPEPSDAFNAGYALRVLSRDPNAWLVTSDPQVFAAVTRAGRPPLWVIDTATGAPATVAARTQRIGRFLVGWPPEPVAVSMTPDTIVPGMPVVFEASGFTPGERVSAWLTAPDGTVVDVAWSTSADAEGRARAEIATPRDAAPGAWALSVAGVTSGATGVARFNVAPGAP